MAFHVKAVEQHLVVYYILFIIVYMIFMVLFTMMCMVVLIFKSVDEILLGGHSYGSFFSVPLFKILYKVHLVSTF